MVFMSSRFKNVGKRIQRRMAEHLFDNIPVQTYRPYFHLLSSWVHRLKPVWGNAYTQRLEARIREMNEKFYRKPLKR
jgi:hypothetical protein